MLPWSVKEKKFPKSDSIVKKIKFLVRYGILAPSSFNTQPWKFQITENELLVFPDFTKTRKYVDPEDRELYISLGCSMANIEVAANYFGMVFQKKYGEEKDTFVARYKFINGTQLSTERELFESITKRQTNRGSYQKKKIPISISDIVEQREPDNRVNLKLITNIKIKNELGKLIEKSELIWFKNREMVKELEHWLEDDMKSSEDGLATGTLNLYKLAIEVKYILSGEPKNIISRAEKYRQLINEAPAVVLISTEKDDKLNWIKAGETFERLILELTSQGYSSSFFNSVIQLPGQRHKMEKMLKVKGKAQLLFRIGIPEFEEPHLPRKNIENVLIGNT